MKRNLIALLGLALVVTALTGLAGLRAAPDGAHPEYATLRWDGRDNTHLIRPDGTVENLGAKFASLKKPNRTDDRSFYMNVAMNALAREGYELVALTPDDYVFKRAAR